MSTVIYRVSPGTKVRLKEWNPDDRALFADNEEKAAPILEKLNGKLQQLQELLYAEHKQKILIVLQGMDTCGKDGTIRHVFEGVNPSGVRVASFKAPTPEELDHDYLWRIHKQAPGRGEIAIFNRSHYEDVLVVRVRNLVPKRIWRARYDQINEFERMLAREGTTILKFFLHIDKDEQKKRLEARLEDPAKQWKFRAGDLEERKLWPAYMRAYEEAIARTSTAWAPWTIVPANAKWYRNLVIGAALVAALERLDMKYPEPEDLGGITIV